MGLPKYADLEKMTDKQLIETMYDGWSEGVVINPCIFALDELARRRNERSSAKMLKISRIALIVSILAVIISVLAICFSH